MTDNPAYFSFCGMLTKDRVSSFKSAFATTMQDQSRVRGKPDHAFILFHSHGGENRPALELHEFLAERAKAITAINIGYVCSAALTMFLAIPRERRFMAEHAVFMAHDVLLKIEGEATEAEMAGFGAERRLEAERVREIVCHGTNLTHEEWDCAVQFGREIWRNQTDAVESGFVSGVGRFWLPSPVHIVEL